MRNIKSIIAAQPGDLVVYDDKNNIIGAYTPETFYIRLKVGDRWHWHKSCSRYQQLTEKEGKEYRYQVSTMMWEKLPKNEKACMRCEELQLDKVKRKWL